MVKTVRQFIRSAGLVHVVAPVVELLEKWSLARYGRIERRATTAGSVELRGTAGGPIGMGPPPHYADMAQRPNEHATLAVCMNVFAPLAARGVAWDVGANVGFYTALLAKACGPESRVYAFEPVRDTYDDLRRNLDVAGTTNTTTLCVALGDYDGDASMVVNPSDSTVSAISRVGSLETDIGSVAVDVRAARGDSLVQAGECPVPTVVKVDVEGHELNVIRGMANVLSQPTCRAVLCEIHFTMLESQGERTPDSTLRSLLAAAGFDSIKMISRSHLLALKR